MAGLHDVPVLVREHDPEDRWPVLGSETAEHALRAVVVGEEVALVAVERAVLVDLLVGGLSCATASGDRLGALGIGGVHATLEADEGLAEELRVLLPPPPFEVLERGPHEVVVGPRGFVVTEVDQVARWRCGRRRSVRVGRRARSGACCRWWRLGRRCRGRSAWRADSVCTPGAEAQPTSASIRPARQARRVISR